MTVVLVLLSIVLLIAVAIAWELLRLRRVEPAELDPDEIQRDLSKLYLYEPMRRLLSDADFDFVARQKGLSPRWNRRFRVRRRGVIALYLRDIRRDFNRIWSVCRLLAPMNPDPNFSTRLLRQLVVFYGYYFVVQVCCVIGCYCYVPLNVGPLVSGLRGLGRLASETLRTTDTLAFQTPPSTSSH
jgi:hypothetical protein